MKNDIKELSSRGIIVLFDNIAINRKSKVKKATQLRLNKLCCQTIKFNQRHKSHNI